MASKPRRGSLHSHSDLEAPEKDGELKPRLRDTRHGFELGKITSNQDRFDVLGPESELKALRSAITETVMVDGAKETVTRVVSIGVMNSTLRLKESRPARYVEVNGKNDRNRFVFRHRWRAWCGRCVAAGSADSGEYGGALVRSLALDRPARLLSVAIPRVG